MDKKLTREEKLQQDLLSLTTLVKNAQTNSFDTTGYRNNFPLRKRIFYTQPYLTCQYCNTIYFISNDKARYLETIKNANHNLELPDIPAYQHYKKKPKKHEEFPHILIESEENLPPCRNCHKVDGLVHGAHDFTDYIRNQALQKEQRRLLEISSATKIVRSYRRYLMRLYGRSVREAMRTINYLKFLASLKINSLARGRLARRRYITEKAIRIIYTSHPLLIRYALRSKPGQKKVFWYKREVERKLLFENYLVLVDKTGFTPPRLLVERNLQEIARRILERKNELIVLIQKRWRGFLSRRIVKYFRTEISRMFSVSVAKVIKIQATYRGHFVRVNMGKYHYHRYREKMKELYEKEARLKLLTKDKNYAKELSMISYQKDFQIEKTSRMISKLPYGGEYNDPLKGYVTQWDAAIQSPKYKMKIFQDSNLADNQTLDLLKNDLLCSQNLVDNESAEIYRDIYRKQFILNRIDEKGPYGYGLRSGEAEFVFTAYPVFNITDSFLISSGVSNMKINHNPNEKKMNANNRKKSMAFMNSILSPSKKQQQQQFTSIKETNSRDEEQSFRGQKSFRSQSMDDDYDYDGNTDITSVKKFDKLNLLKQPETSRQKAMRYYFQQNLTEIANRVIERVNKGQPPLGAVDMNEVERQIKKLKKQHLLNQLKQLPPPPRTDMGSRKARRQNIKDSIVDPAKKLQDEIQELELSIHHDMKRKESMVSFKGGNSTPLQITNGNNNPFGDEIDTFDDNSTISSGSLASHNTFSTGTASVSIQKKQRLKLINDFKQYNQEKKETKQILEQQQQQLVLFQQFHADLLNSSNNSGRGSPSRTSRSRKGSESRRGSTAVNGDQTTIAAKKTTRINKGFQFPKDINFNSLEWLHSNEDM